MMTRFLYVVMYVAMTMIVGVANASTIHATKDSRHGKPLPSVSRGLLDCSAVVELYDGYADPSAYLPATGDVEDWLGYGPYWHGGELVFHIAFPANDYGWDWTFSFRPGDGCDPDLFVMAGGCGEEHAISFHNYGASGTAWSGELWFALDGYSGYPCDIGISFEMTEYELFDFCTDVVDVEGVGIFQGDTCDGYDSPAGTCVVIPPTDGQYFSDGLEDYYGVFMPAGSSFAATLFHSCDASMRLMDACIEPMNCVGYVDYHWSDVPPAFVEFMPFSNDTGMDATFYLVIDAYDDCCGDYELVFESDDGAIANEMMSLGDVKRIYR